MPALSRLLQPKSIAVVGGGAWCASVVQQCLKMGFSGPVWPVHPTRDTVGGVVAVSRLEDLPAPPDATFIGVNRNITVDTVRALSQMGAGGAVCFASGFREAQAETGDGATLQDALLDAAGDMPIIGPNCYGFINYLDGALLWPDQHGGQRVDSGVAILTQSSNMAINLTMQTRSIPLAYIATAGNQAQIGLSQIGAELLNDSRVTALGMHIEGIGDLRAFETLASQAHELGKPIVALKAGRSDQAQAAAVSHTASLAGSDAGARALLRRLGIAQVDSLTSLLETLKLLHITGPLRSNRIASMSCSGGEASLMADAALSYNIEYPSLDTAQYKHLRDALGPMVALANPLDYHTFIWTDTSRMADTFSAISAGDNVDMGIIVSDFPRADRCDPSAWDCVIDAAEETHKRTKKPLAILATLPDACPEPVSERIMKAGLVPLLGIDDALTAIDRAAWLGRHKPNEKPLLLPQTRGEDVQVLSEADSKAALAEYGLVVPHASRVVNIESIADDMPMPVALKGEGFAHKTEAGAVVLNLPNRDAMIDAAHHMQAKAYLVEEMITEGVIELLIGVVKDPAHGFILTLAAGGVMTELMQDSTTLLLPVTDSDVIDALSRLRCSQILYGFRGKPGVDLNCIVEAVTAVQAYVIDHAQSLEELEINPLICTPSRAVAADALIRKTS